MTSPSDSNATRRTILVVDDFPAVRRLLTSILQDMGYRAVEAEDGFDALNRLSVEPFDLVLTDVRMPGLDGIELVRAVRQIAPKASIVVMTGANGFASNGTGDLAPEVHIDALCLKPFRTAELIDTVRGLLAA